MLTFRSVRHCTAHQFAPAASLRAGMRCHSTPRLLLQVHIDWAGAGAGSSTMPASLPMAIFARPAQQRGQRSTEEVRRSSPKHEAGDKAAHGEQKALHLGTTPSLDCQEEPAPVPGAAGRGAGCLGGEGSPGPGVAAALAAAAAAADAWRAGGGRARGSGGGARPPSATTADGAPPADPGAAGEVLRRNLQLIVDDVRCAGGLVTTAMQGDGGLGLRWLRVRPPLWTNVAACCPSLQQLACRQDAPVSPTEPRARA